MKVKLKSYYYVKRWFFLDNLIRKIFGDRKDKIRIDSYDTFSLDITLAEIIHPCLVQLRDTSSGVPSVDDEDVPEELSSKNAEPKENEWDCDSNWEKRWDYVINEMIFAFENIKNDDEDQFFDFDPDPNDKNIKRLAFSEKHYTYDKVGHEKHNDRIDKGLRLFGKYYRGLWD